MKEIIENILEEENCARKRVEEAKEKARSIRLRTEEDAQKVLSDARVTGQKDAKDLLQKAEMEANNEKEKIIKQRAISQDLLLTQKKKALDQTVDLLLKMVLGEESGLS